MTLKAWWAFAALAILPIGPRLGAQQLPTGFHIASPIVGRNLPTGVAFAHDGRVFVSEKSGLIWVYRNLLDAEPQVFADLTAEVYNYLQSDRGLLGLALDPNFPEQPYVYVQYAYNGGLFSDAAPRWPTIDGLADDCPAAPAGGPTRTQPGSDTYGGGCVISGRISRLTATGNTAGAELVLVEDWYQQFSSHSIGTLLFGPDGYLVAGGGDGASFTGTDYGEWGNPFYPDQRSPRLQGGALRAQGLEVEAQYSGQVWLDGSIIRINPATGVGAPGNPLAGPEHSPNAQRILAYGLRNPFRFTVRPQTDGELWVGNVGYNTFESIDVIPPASSASGLRNFGWPCFEGRQHTEGYGSAALAICNQLYVDGDTGGLRTPWTQPWYAYLHQGSSDITGLVFYEGTSYPAQYRNALFFADNSRSVIFDVPYVDANHDGIPDAPRDNQAPAFFGGATATAVDLVSGPGGDIAYVNIGGGRITRIYYCGTASCTEQAPSAAIALAQGSTADGPPRTLSFTAANSVDPNAGDVLTYDWDLDGDGIFGDAGGSEVGHTYASAGSFIVSVRVTDQAGGSDVRSLRVSVGDPAIVADLGVTLDDGLTRAIAGQAVTYTATVSNHGGVDVHSESVSIALAAELANVTWTCTGSAGAACSASGSGNFTDTVDVPAGGNVTYLVHATVPLEAAGSIQIAEARIAPPAGASDPDLADNVADDADTVVAESIFSDGFDGG